MSGRSLGLNWLRRFDRSLIVPEVVFSPRPQWEGQNESGGYYLPPIQREAFIGGNFYDCRFGVLVIGTQAKDDDSIAEGIAHEWRHHWQLHNGMRFDHHSWDAGEDYWRSIRNYFRSSKSEMDALLFSAKMVRRGFHHWWLDAVLGGERCAA